MTKVLLYLPLVLALAACSSDDSANSDTSADEPATTVQELENSGAVPKLARSADLEGTDADNNGIRDDVDDYISDQFSESFQISAANQAARANQAVLGTELLCRPCINRKINNTSVLE